MTLHPALTPRESEVMRLVCDGLSEQEIAGRLEVSPHTVHTIRDNARQKLGAPSLPGAAAIYSAWATRDRIYATTAPAPMRRSRKAKRSEGQMELAG